jgi:hypothetical protein
MEPQSRDIGEKMAKAIDIYAHKSIASNLGERIQSNIFARFERVRKSEEFRASHSVSVTSALSSDTSSKTERATETLTLLYQTIALPE